MKKKTLFTFFIFFILCSSFAQDNRSFADVRGNVLNYMNYSFTDFESEIPKNTKQIIAWNSKLTEKGDTITSKSETWHYDKNQNLISWFEFEYYDFESGYRILHEIHKGYDIQNRIISLDESQTGFSDWIIISYPTKNTITEEYRSRSLSESFTKVSFDYDSKGRILRREVRDSTCHSSTSGYEIYHYVTVYKYDKNDNLIEENTLDLPNFITAETINYTYNKYNQILRKETNTKQKDGSFHTSIIKYNYYGYLRKGESKPKIFTINTTTISDNSTEFYVEYYTFSERNVIEIETTLASTYRDEIKKNTFQLIYKDGRLIRKKYFSESRRQRDSKVISWIDYQYIFY